MRRELLRAEDVFCADVGSVRRNRFGWSDAVASCSGHLPSQLVRVVADRLNARRSVALGFECPLFVPLPQDELELGAARPGEADRAWSAGAGCGALATGLVQVAWVMAHLRPLVNPSVAAFLSWDDFAAAGRGLLIWEAFVSGADKKGNHVADAAFAARAFARALPNPGKRNAIESIGGVYSLVAAALLRTGWATNIDDLAKACLVIRANANDGMNVAAYEAMFQKLGFKSFDSHKKLQHPALPITLYFNRNREGVVSFAVYAKDRECFRRRLWEFIPAQQKKDDDPKLRTVVPKAGREEEAFRDLLKQ